MIVNTATIPYQTEVQNRRAVFNTKKLSKRDEVIISELNERIEREESGKAVYYTLEESRKLLHESEQQWKNTK